MASLSDRLAVNEIQARLSKQLGYCWNVLAGAKYAENQIIDIKITVNPDRTVRDAQVLDQMRYSTDTYFRAAADSALRALRHPTVPRLICLLKSMKCGKPLPSASTPV